MTFQREFFSSHHTISPIVSLYCGAEFKPCSLTLTPMPNPSASPTGQGAAQAVGLALPDACPHASTSFSRFPFLSAFVEPSCSSLTFHLVFFSSHQTISPFVPLYCGAELRPLSWTFTPTPKPSASNGGVFASPAFECVDFQLAYAALALGLF